MIDDSTYDCDFSLEEQIEASKKHFEDLYYRYSVPFLEINKDFETILLCAVRYAIGRKSYMPSMVIDYITPLLPYLSYWILGLMAAEIIDHNYKGGLGDEKIDKPYWLDFLRKIRLEMEGRNEP